MSSRDIIIVTGWQKNIVLLGADGAATERGISTPLPLLLLLRSTTAPVTVGFFCLLSQRSLFQNRRSYN